MEGNRRNPLHSPGREEEGYVQTGILVSTNEGTRQGIHED